MVIPFVLLSASANEDQAVRPRPHAPRVGGAELGLLYYGRTIIFFIYKMSEHVSEPRLSPV